MSESLARLKEYAKENEPSLAEADLDLLVQLKVTNRFVAEQLIWENKEKLLEHFETLCVLAFGAAQLPGADSPERHVDGGDSLLARESAESGELGTAPKPVEENQLGKPPEGNELGGEPRHRLDKPEREPGSPAEHDSPAAGPAASGYQAARAEQPGHQLEPEPEPDPTRPFAWSSHSRFGSYDWSQGKAEPIGHLSTYFIDGMVEFEWTPAPETAKVTLYRIVSSNETWPTGAPELASQVGVATDYAGRAKVDPLGSGVTFFAVWLYQGDSALAASRSQPKLIGFSEVVWPPSSLSINVTPDKAVTGSWQAPAGSRVEVQRFPAGMQINYDPSRMLPEAAVSTGGFIDRDAPQGTPVVYAAFCVSPLPSGASGISEPIYEETLVVPDAQQIELSVKRSTSRTGSYDLTWIPPKNGEVELYATNVPLPAGLEKEARPWEILEREGLTEEFRVAYPADDLGGVKIIREFIVDPNWVRAHFVAVHRVDGEHAWMSKPVSMVSPAPPRWAKVVERVDSQILIFPWPDGVKFVEAYQSPFGMEVDPCKNQSIAQLTKEDYDRRGGMRVSRALPSNGCALHLFGVVYLGGEEVYSTATTIDYPGVTRVSYELVPMAGNQSAFAGQQPSHYRVYCTSDTEVRDLPIALVGHPARLPLEPAEGEMFATTTVNLGSGVRTHVLDVQAGSRGLYGRLFVTLPPDEVGQVAILDPDIDTLTMWL